MYQNTIKSSIQWGLLFLLIGVLEVILGLGIFIHPFISIVAFCLVFIITLSLINPDIGIVALIFTVPFAFGKFNLNLTEIYTLDIVHIMLFCLIFLYLIVFGRERDLQFSRSPIDIFYLIFLSWAMLSIVWSPNFFTGMVHLFMLVIIYLLFYLTYFAIKDVRSLEYAIWGWWLVGTIFFLVGIMQYLGVLEIEISYKTALTEGYSRVIGFSGSPSAFARIMLLTFFTMLGAFQFFKGRIKKLLTGFCLIFSLFIIILTLSRSAFIGLFFGILLYGFRYLRKIPAQYILFFLIFCVLFSVFGTLSGIEFGKRIESILKFYKEGAWIIRMTVWGTSLKMLFDSYGLGVGLGGVEALFSKVFHHPFPVGGVTPHAHSLYIDVLSHFGLIGFSLFLILVIRLVQYLRRSQRKIGRSALGEMLWALCCGLVSVGVQLIITGLLHVSELWIYIGMTIACANIGEKELNLKR